MATVATITKKKVKPTKPAPVSPVGAALSETMKRIQGQLHLIKRSE